MLTQMVGEGINQTPVIGTEKVSQLYSSFFSMLSLFLVRPQIDCNLAIHTSAWGAFRLIRTFSGSCEDHITLPISCQSCSLSRLQRNSLLSLTPSRCRWGLQFNPPTDSCPFFHPSHSQKVFSLKCCRSVASTTVSLSSCLCI